MKEKIYFLKLGLIGVAFKILGKKNVIRFLVKDAKKNSLIEGRAGMVVLSCEKTHFSKDVDQIVKRSDLRIIRLNGGFLEFFQKHFTPRELHKQTEFQLTQRSNKFERDWKTLERFAEDLLVGIERSFSLKIDRVLVANIDYWQTDGIRMAAQKRNIPFMALVRENFLLPELQVSSRDYYLKYNFKFEGDKIAVFSKLTKDLFVAAKLFAEDKIVVTGAPRFDVWRDIALDSFEDRKTITLFTFAHPDYLAPKTFVLILKEFIEIAKSFPDFKFVIKAKDRTDYFLILKINPNIPSNVEVNYQVKVPDIIKASRLVIGFNSLTILEAVIAEAIVGVPYFNDSKKLDDFLMFTPTNPKHSEYIHFYREEGEMREHISRVIGSAEVGRWYTPAARQECINSMLYYPKDKTNSQVVVEFLKGT